MSSNSGFWWGFVLASDDARRARKRRRRRIQPVNGVAPAPAPRLPGAAASGGGSGIREALQALTVAVLLTGSLWLLMALR